MADVAAAAGIGKGTIYEYFRSRDEIFLEAFRFMMQDFEERWHGLEQHPLDPEEKIKRLFNAFYDSFVQYEEFMEIILDFWAEGIRRKDERGESLFDMKEMYAFYRQPVEKVLQEGIENGKFKPMDTAIVAASIIGLTDGLMIQWIVDRQLFDFREALNTAMETILNGIKK